MEVRGGHQMPQHWSYWWLWVFIWMLGINPESPGRTASVSNHWVPSLDPFYFNNNNDNNNCSLLLVHEDNVVDLVLLFYLIVDSVGWTQLTRLVHTASPLSAEPSHGSHSGFWYRIWHKPQVDLEFTIPLPLTIAITGIYHHISLSWVFFQNWHNTLIQKESYQSQAKNLDLEIPLRPRWDLEAWSPSCRSGRILAKVIFLALSQNDCKGQWLWRTSAKYYFLDLLGPLYTVNSQWLWLYIQDKCKIKPAKLLV